MASIESPQETPLRAADLEAAQGLVAEAGWNQVAADWRLFLQLGQGFAARDAAAGLVGTAATLPYPSGFGWISMVLVAKAFRRRGIATRLLGRCIEALKAASMVPVLDATPAGREVYRPLGFRDGWPITRWRGRGGSRADGGGPKVVRALEDADWREVLALDARAFGCDRSALLGGLRARSGAFACVIEENGRLEGFLLGRDGRVATQLGPIVAEDEASACALAGWAVERASGALIVDALDRHAGLARWLASHGFEKERPYTRMALGRDELFGDPSRLAAIAGPELG